MILLATVVSLEVYLCDGMNALFKKAVAAIKLLKVWASLRWDDTVGAPPHRLILRLSGLEGLHERTKVSGPAKKSVWLPFFIGMEAYIVKPQWLAVAQMILTEGAFDFEGDYLL